MMKTLNGRRNFLKLSFGAGAGVLIGLTSYANGEQKDENKNSAVYGSWSEKKLTDTGFFHTKQDGNRWWFITPNEKPFFSIGLNHIDSTTLRYQDNRTIWDDKYNNDMKLWLSGTVRKDLISWGFNTVGWNQEYVMEGHHSRNFTPEEYRWLDMPYGHMLRFSETHQWETETRHPDIMSNSFAEWCDYVARDDCGRLKNDPNLIGYYFTDCPTWVHTRAGNEWKGPLFDPEKLKSKTGKNELSKLASRYYQVIHDAIRRYDTNHLILGDRYEAMAPLPEEIVTAALPYVDVFSFQCFAVPDVIKQKLEYWANFTKKPILLADSSGWIKSDPHDNWPADNEWHQDPDQYVKTMDVVREIQGCVGFHLCGAYLRNLARNYGLRDNFERIDENAISIISKKNHEVAQWVADGL